MTPTRRMRRLRPCFVCHARTCKPAPQRRVKRGATVLILVCLIWNAVNTGPLIWIPVQMKAEQESAVQRVMEVKKLADQAEVLMQMLEEYQDARTEPITRP